VQNAYDLFQDRSTFGERMADWVASVAGSWHFIITQSVILAAWVILNVTAFMRHWDPYPFILMNLVLSLQAAYTAPLIMISQNRQNRRDRLAADVDYQVNAKAEEEIRVVLEHLEAQSQAIVEVRDTLNHLLRKSGS
jgi:uncharacterized membrane protein